jgi:Domain of unknown function DUF29
MLEKKLKMPEADVSLYDSDFFEWTQNAAEDLRRRRVTEADIEHIAEEIEDLGKRDRRETRSRMTVLLVHLLKWAAQPACRKGGTWLATINEQRGEIEGVLEQSPSLRNDLIQQLPAIFRKAASRAARETNLPLSVFLTPDRLPGVTDLDRLLSEDFFPEEISDLFQ